MELATLLPLLLGLAWLLPLGAFLTIFFFGPKMGRGGIGAGYLGTAAIIGAFLLSATALTAWLITWPPVDGHAHASGGGGHQHAEVVEEPGGDGAEEHSAAEANGTRSVPATMPTAISGEWYTLVQVGGLRLTVSYYIDALTLAMFVMVTLIASCIFVYSMGYMHDELHAFHDPAVPDAEGRPLQRPGRFSRFYQYLSLFCFSMLGLVVAGNVFMVFMFWELVGICSYLLIGFYIERASASRAANKAFIVNRVGDFGMIVGLAVLWTGLGTFSFADTHGPDGAVQPGIFSQVRPAEGGGGSTLGGGHALVVPEGFVRLAAREEIQQIAREAGSPDEARATVADHVRRWQEAGVGYWLLVLAGLGIFCGCVGKSAQFPLHVWLPDAMEGPTPVSALIHAATMVAAGVYLVGRFYPVFAPEVLLTIAWVGTVTLFIAATIALTATDIKRVLAYSTVSQLGFMMMALGVGGWLAGMFHLFTHAFFKALLFLGSGSVIHATGTNEMPEMGGLLKKMPWTAWTMLVGCLAIAGAGIPLVIGLSGYHSKDLIIEQALSFRAVNPLHGIILYLSVFGAGLTACYMFRLWFLTFIGTPRNRHVYEHAHESPKTMYVPLVILAALAAVGGWNFPFTNLGLVGVLEQARPLGTELGAEGGRWAPSVVMPAEHLAHALKTQAGLVAFAAAALGFLLAAVYYWWRKLDPAETAEGFRNVYRFLRNKWWFDELYQAVFVRPTLWLAGAVATVDRRGIDWLADGSARLVAWVARLDGWFDRLVIDGLVNGIADWTYRAAIRLRGLQSGNLRQYVVYIAVGTVALFVIISLWISFQWGDPIRLTGL